MFSLLASKFFGGNLTDTLNEYRIITREAFAELNYSWLSPQLMDTFLQEYNTNG